MSRASARAISPSDARTQGAVRAYWDGTSPTGRSRAIRRERKFFEEVEAYRFEKLSYLPQRVDFAGYPGRSVLDVGCGLGNDLPASRAAVRS